MANKNLKSIKFPGLSDTYVVPQIDTTLTQTGRPADAKATGDAISALGDSVDEDIDALKEDLSFIDFENVNNINELAVNNKYYDYTYFVWNQGKPVLSNGSITFDNDSKSLNSGFIPENSTDTFNLKVPAGYKAIIYYVDKNDGTYTVSTTSSWITNTTYTDSVGSLYHYIIVRLVKVDGSSISVTETQLLTVRLYVIKDSTLAGKSDLNALSADYQNFKVYTEEKLSSEVNIPYTATQGRIVVSGGALTIQSSTEFCYTSYIDMSSLSSVLIDVPSGYKVAGFLADNASGTHVTYDPTNPTSGYATNTTVTIEKDALRPYLIISVLKDPSATIVPSDVYTNIRIYKKNTNDVFTKIDEINPLSATATGGQILYEGDTLVNSGHIVNAVMYKDGVIIGARSDGKIVRIGYSGTEEVVLSLTGTNFEWRCLYMDSNENVYASPHASSGNMNQSDRGLYRLVKGANTMSKVISLYDTGSSVTTETQTNDDTIWTMCEDKDGNLYAGVYAHTIRANPAVYKSMDGGETWTYFINFNTAGLTTNGMHIHSIVYSKWQKAIYCIVGEINTIFKSVDDGETWVDLDIKLTVKGSSMLPTPYGIFIGSDGAYNCEIDLLYNDDTTHKNVYRGIAGTVFAIRSSDVTGFLYAFTKIDSSVNSTSYYPPATVLDGTTTIEQWRGSVSTAVYNNWLAYHDSVVDMYPDDSIRPQHYTILVSRNGGKDWEPLIRFSCLSTYPNGLWTTGYFFNGECLTGRFEDGSILRPVIISEGKHRYVADGCDLEGEILIRTNTSSIVEVVS